MNSYGYGGNNVDYVPFHKTRMGETFICKTVPDLIRAIERLNDLLERLVTAHSSSQHDNREDT